MNARYYIGIDPGVKTGLAIWDANDKILMDVMTTKLHKAIEIIRAFYTERKSEGVMVRFEDARLRTWFGNSGSERKKGAGSVCRDCKAWEDLLLDYGVPFEAVPPKHNITKLDAAQFALYTKWIRITSQHGRDAAMLVYGK